MNINTLDMTPVESLLEHVRIKYVNSGMKYGWKSNHVDYDAGHWNNMILPYSKHISYDQNKLPYLEEHPLIKNIWEYVQQCIGNRTLVRAYCNGYTFGTDAYYHKDDTWIQEVFGDDCVSETILIYLNDEWDRDWGGETSLLDEDNNFLGATFPNTKQALVFDSDIWHRAGLLSRACPVLRSVLVFKTAGPELNRPFVKWIKDRTHDIPHSGTTMFNHLYATALAISSFRGTPAYMVRAGLYHSVYDTAYFKANLGVTKEEVVEQIGEDAEEVVSWFCKLDNRFESIYNNKEGWDPELHFALCILELANTMEQAPRQPPNEETNRRIRMMDDKIQSFKLNWD